MPVPGSEFFHPRSRVKRFRILDPDPHQRSIALEKMILDVPVPGSGFFSIPDPDPQHCFLYFYNFCDVDIMLNF
jgi:hypothetical protein